MGTFVELYHSSFVCGFDRNNFQPLMSSVRFLVSPIRSTFVNSSYHVNYLALINLQENLLMSRDMTCYVVILSSDEVYCMVLNS